MMKCYKFVASLHVLSDALPILVKLSKKFQSSSLNFAHLQPSLDAAMVAIEALKEEHGTYFQQTETFIADLRSEDLERGIIITVTEAD